MKISVKVTDGKAQYGKVYKGEILEDGVLVGSFRQRSFKNGIFPMEIRFRIDGAKDRFMALADTLTMQERIEAMLGI